MSSGNDRNPTVTAFESPPAGSIKPISELVSVGAGAGAVRCRRCGHVGEPVGRGQCARCKSWVPRNVGRLETGVYSAQARQALQPAIEAERHALLRSLVHTERTVPPVTAYVVDSLLESRMIAASFFKFLAERSAGDIAVLGVTTRGRIARATDSHGRAVDRVAKLAGMLGLERRPRRTRRATAPMAALKRALEGDDHA